MLMIVGYPTENEEDFQQTIEMFERYKPYSDAGTIEEVNLGLTLNLLKDTPLYNDRKKYNIVQANNHINDWVCLENPTLTYKERLRRRIILQARCEALGYRVFESKNYLKQLISSWNEVSNLAEQSVTLIKNISYDREKSGLTAEIVNEG
jgi:radical SAM superfamily enzyme YgiQ (UPF0313 family)